MTKRGHVAAAVVLAGLAGGTAGARGAFRGFSGGSSHGFSGGGSRGFVGGFSRGYARGFSRAASRASPGSVRSIAFSAGRAFSAPTYTPGSAPRMGNARVAGVNFAQGFHSFRTSGFTSSAPQGFGRVMNFQGPRFSSRPSGLTPVPVTHAPMPEQGMGYVFPRRYAVSQPNPPTIGQPLPSIESEVLRMEYSNPAPRNLGPHDVIVPRSQDDGGVQNIVNASAAAPVLASPGPNQAGGQGRRLGEGRLDQNPGTSKGPGFGGN